MTRLKAVRLSPSDPHSALRRAGRQMPARHAAPRRLSEQQLKNPLIRTAYERLGNMVSYRGQFLRRLDGVHGDRRTRLEKFVAIERVAEQLLLRLDLATSVLGYIDPANGRYVLNTQCGIAEDAGISAPALCRLLKTLDEAGYVYRRHERIRLDERDSNGLHLVRTRVLVRFTKLFWKDLGLAYVFERVQKSAKKRRDAQLREMGQARLAEMEQHSLELKRREVSRQRWEVKEAREAARSGALEASAGRSSQPTARHAGGDVMSALGRLAASVAKKI
jgi:DNA-binding Lrp family transcriptional regulator